MAMEMDPRHLVVHGKPISVDWGYLMERFTIYLLIALGTRIATSLSDALVLVVTWVKTARNLTEGARIAITRKLRFCHNSDINPILISRFLLNLRQVGSPEIDSQEAFNSQFSVPGFRIPSLASIIGNMGEDLDYGGLAEEVEDEAENTSESIQAEEGAVPETIIEKILE
ncbi:hypothetical protein PHLCEN_2v10041 [Hermanssonia centrifuga]|uniref:Uncharacterized protein n=1 Tax=Hermanssonia centrifuga TaxID=98765 RepID=A0A2R6NP30_9APHY|nr:hypothetical protein PHLCEN_2v10041 [Hermanssonia centrifuga]